MPYEHDEKDMQQEANETFQGPRGELAGVTYLRLRNQWSAWTRDPSGGYEHEVCDTRGEALDALRRKGVWPGVPDAR